ncbi:hypothetical protein LXA43DRAFT_1061133 [Ganoderma leucocontextum]|nr:hypothetical protein LXA43DRAFT_1061133 [Ganoderma leucocontextum]
MSSNDITVAEYAGVVIDNYCEIAATDFDNCLFGTTALIIYESMIITGQEARYFWSERLAGAAVLFYLNKDVPAAVVQSTYVIEILVYFPWAVPIAVNWANFWYGINGVNVPVLGCANFWYGINGVNVPVLGCVSNVLTPTEITRKFTVGTSTFTITSSEGASIMFDRVIGSLDQSLSVDDFFGVDMDVDETVKDSSKDYKGPIGCEVIELPLRSSSTEGAVDCDIVEVC